MMKTNLFKFAIVIMLFLTCCKKHDNNQESLNPPPNSLLKSISVFDTTGKLWLINTLYYDSLYRLIKISGVQYESNLDTILITNTLDYNTVRVQLRKTLSTNTQYLEKITYNLNSSGLVVSSVHVINETQTDSSILSNDTYEYNLEGYLTTRTTTIPGGNPITVTYNYSNMNVESLTFFPSPSNSKQLFYYDASHFNSIGYINAGIRFLGKSCNNPLKKARIESLNIDIATYSYEYNQVNRISRLSTNGISAMPGLDFYTVPILFPIEVLVYTYY